MPVAVISGSAYRRFILGRQGLWPGRRHQGKSGTLAALQTARAVQVDPLQVVAHSQDIVLYGRVQGYRPAYLSSLLYEDREAFEYGGAMFIYPMAELPYWRLPMRRRLAERRWGGFAAENQDLLEHVRAALRERGPLGPRDFSYGIKVENYRGSRDTSLALYALWLFGEVMVHHREGNERVYDLAERIAPPHLLEPVNDAAAEMQLARDAVAFHGIARAQALPRWVAGRVGRTVSRKEAPRFAEELVSLGELSPVQVAGEPGLCYVLSEDLPLLLDVADGRAPKEWTPLGADTTEEVVFLAPLDIVSARGRAKELFDFEYVWEVYKPAPKRRWGYYVLPILYGDRLVGRVDPKFDRRRGTLEILGFWLEDDATSGDADFAAALGRGLAAFAQFLGAEHVVMDAIQPKRLRETAQNEMLKRFIR